MRQLNLDSATYEDFLRVINVLKDNCNDLDIRGGIIRQRSNDRASVFEMSIEHQVEDIDMAISDLKKNIDLLKIFEKQDVSIILDEDGGGDYFEFSDSYSSIKFRPIKEEYIDNKFMSIEEIDAAFILNDEDIILSSIIPKNISERIKTVSSNFNVNAIQVHFEGDTVSLKSETQSKTQSAKFYDGLISERVIHATTSIVTIPFLIDHDSDINITIYNIRDNIIISKFEASIGDTTVVVYTRSSLVMEDVEEDNGDEEE